MGEYYNKGRTPTSATTRNGVTVCFSPRVWQHVPMAEESSSSIQALVRKGFLTRRDSVKDHVVVAVEAAPVSVVAEVPVIAPSVVAVEVEAKIEVIASPNSEVPEEVEIEKEVEAEVAIEDSSGTESLSRSRSSRRR